MSIHVMASDDASEFPFSGHESLQLVKPQTFLEDRSLVASPIDSPFGTCPRWPRPLDSTPGSGGLQRYACIARSSTAYLSPVGSNPFSNLLLPYLYKDIAVCISTEDSSIQSNVKDCAYWTLSTSPGNL